MAQIEQYHDKEVSKLDAHDPDIDITEIYECDVYATEAVVALIDEASHSDDEHDTILWEIVYMSAMNRTPLESMLCTFRAQVGGEWQSMYAEQTQGVVVISFN